MYRFLLFLILFASSLLPALAQQAQRDQKREQVILNDLQQMAPGEVQKFKTATSAMDEGNYDEATRLYSEVVLKAPDFDPALRRLGLCLAHQGKVMEARGLLEHALQTNRSPENLISLAQVLAYPGSGLEAKPDDKRRALELATEAANSAASDTDESYYIAQAQLALELDQTAAFRSATAQLKSKFPNLAATHYFAAIEAAIDEHWQLAEEEILKAESLGLPHETVAAFLDSGIRREALVWRFVYYSLALVGIWILGLVTLLLVGKLMSKTTLRSIENANPNVPTSPSELRLRKLYRLLINVGGIYYYISIPVVMFLVIAVAGSITYAFYSLGSIPIKIVAILVIGALITVFKMGRSLFLRIETEEPGRSLSIQEAPGLWELTRNVAATLQTRPLDEIRVTPGTDLAVYERGTMRERSNNQSKRVLLLGVGVLNGFKLNAFRAVLAHEYGHFSNRDTAGGEIALRVNDHMMKFAHAMYESGQAVWWNVAFNFLRVYHFIFRRLSHGATRLQEVLADRVAAARYGAQAFEDGLKHVIRNSAEFESTAGKELVESSSAKRALQNLYELNPVENPDIAEAIQSQLNRKTTEDDTHPSPEDRFRLTRKITSASELPLAGVIWDLFTDRAGLTTEMTRRIEKGLY